MFNEGHTATDSDELGRAGLSSEAIRLGRVLAELMPDEVEVWGLLALMLLTEARRASRTTADGSMVLLRDQDRSSWDAEMVAEGLALVASCMRRDAPGPYQLQAAINAIHCAAPTVAVVDWRRILGLYDRLLTLMPTPVVALNRAVALAEVAGPDAALDIVDGLDLAEYHLLHATRADLLVRAGRVDDAVPAYRRAIELTTNASERAFLEGRLDEVRNTSAG